MTEHQLPRKTGWRIFQVLVVLLIVAVLAGMILPVIGMNTHGHSRQYMCGKNQSQLLGALVAYTTEFEVMYPGPIDPAIGPITDAHRARLVTHQMLWLLARHGSLPVNFLTCPKSAFRTVAKIDGVRPSLTWGIEPAAAVYAFDWASPTDPRSERAVIADRDQASHDGKVMVTFGDAHVKAFKLVDAAQRTTGILITEGPDGKAVTGAIAIPLEDRYGDDPSLRHPDDIYTNEHEGAPDYDSLSQGQAHSWRAWVK